MMRSNHIWFFEIISYYKKKESQSIISSFSQMVSPWHLVLCDHITISFHPTQFCLSSLSTASFPTKATKLMTIFDLLKLYKFWMCHFYWQIRSEWHIQKLKMSIFHDRFNQKWHIQHEKLTNPFKNDTFKIQNWQIPEKWHIQLNVSLPKGKKKISLSFFAIFNLSIFKKISAILLNVSLSDEYVTLLTHSLKVTNWSQYVNFEKVTNSNLWHFRLKVTHLFECVIFIWNWHI